MLACFNFPVIFGTFFDIARHEIIALNAVLLFRGHEIRARIAFRRRVKTVENVVRKDTQ